MTTPDTAIRPVQVHITADDTKDHAPGRGIAIGKTVVLTATNPSDQLLPQDKGRLYALVQVFDNQAVLCYSEAQVGNSANTTTGLANPDGTLCPTGVVIPIRCSNAIWVTSAAYPTRVSVLAVYPD